MTFNSFAFLIFLPAVLVVYYLLRCRLKLQNRFLLAASYLFYGWWDWRFLALIAGSTIVDFVAGLRIADTSGSRRRCWMIASLTTNLGILGLFKYFDFFAISISSGLQSLGIQTGDFTLGLVLPVGISFYTFQSLAYTIEVYRRRLIPCRDFLDFALYLSFFPQLVAGPIERPQTLLPQVSRERRPTLEMVSDGAWLVLLGFFKKVFLADNVSAIADKAFASDFSGASIAAWIGVYAFSIQIYCDFSGYSDIARGVAKFLGFELRLNFLNPYISRNPSEFWRRWHISLSEWLRDYLYISLGGNRDGWMRTYRNLLATMVLGGLWHGASWLFVIWGGFHGLWLVVHRFASERRMLAWIRDDSVCWRIASILASFHLVCVSWVFFRASDLSVAMHLLGTMASWPALDEKAFVMGTELTPYLFGFLGIECLQLMGGERWLVHRTSALATGAVYGAMMYLVLAYGKVSDGFIYFQF